MTDEKSSRHQTKDEGPKTPYHSKWTKGPSGWTYDHPHGPPPPPPSGYTYVWITSGDDLTCPVCAPLHGTLYADTWTTFPPRHPNCRCTIALIPQPI